MLCCINKACLLIFYHLPSTFNATKTVCSEPSEAGAETSGKISQRGQPVTARKKCHHLCVNISHVGGQVY